MFFVQIGCEMKYFVLNAGRAEADKKSKCLEDKQAAECRGAHVYLTWFRRNIDLCRNGMLISLNQEFEPVDLGDPNEQTEKHFDKLNSSFSG